MSKPRRKPPHRPQPPLPSVGHYVLMFQAPDGTMQDPPVPLDQRLTDAELRELVDGVHAKLKARQTGEAAPGVASNQADELPGGIKMEEAAPTPSNLPADQMTAHSGTVGSQPVKGFEPEDIAAALARSPAYTGPPMTEEEIDRVLAGNGIPPAPDAKTPAAGPAPKPQELPPVSPDARGSAKPEHAVPADDGWADATAKLFYQGACIFTGACLLSAGVILGGWAALKALPWLEATLAG